MMSRKVIRLHLPWNCLSSSMNYSLLSNLPHVVTKCHNVLSGDLNAVNQLSSLSSSRRLQSPKYNQGLTGRGKSKKHKNISLPTLSGEVLYGSHPVHLALKAKKRKHFHQLFVDKNMHLNDVNAASVDMAQQLGVPVVDISKLILNQLAGNRPHQGVCLDCEPLKCPKWNDLESMPRLSESHPIWLFLYNVQDPMNVGAILRSAFLLGVHRIVMPTVNSCRLSPVVSKASAGAMEVADIVQLGAGSSELDLCQWWRDGGGEILVTGKDNSDCTDVCDFAVTRPNLLVLGNEGSGLSTELMDLSDHALWVRHRHEFPGIDSLNVSVAAGILLHWLSTSAQIKR